MNHEAVIDTSSILWRTCLGKPDGLLIRLRCYVLGHSWEVCHSGCCDGKVVWCLRCLACDYAAVRGDR